MEESQSLNQSQFNPSTGDGRLLKLEEAIQVTSEQPSKLSILARNPSDASSVVSQATCHVNVESALKLNATVVKAEDTMPKIAGTREMCEGVLRTVKQGVPPPPSIEDSRITEHLPTLAHTKHTLKVAKVTGTINSRPVTILLDSGASCFVIFGRDIPVTDLQPLHGVQLVNADGRHIFPSGTSVMSVSLGNLQAEHTFMVVDALSTPVILRL